MKKIAKPVNTNLKKLDELIRDSYGKEKPKFGLLHAEDAFNVLTNDELTRSYKLLKLLSNRKKLNYTVKLAKFFDFNQGISEKLLRKSNLSNLYGGATLLKTQHKVDRLFEFGISSILQYNSRFLKTETDFNHSMNNTINAIAHAATQEKIPFVSVKISGLVRQGYLEFLQSGKGLNISNWRDYRSLLKRLDSICYTAATKNIKLVFTAEETWQQNMVDHLVTLMMKRYNKDEVIVYNTIQLYRKDGLQFLMDALDKARKQGYKLGVQLVTGGYRMQEMERVEKEGYPALLFTSKAAVLDAFHLALKFCLENIADIAVLYSTHSIPSIRFALEVMVKRNIPKNHPHLYFCQMLGMADAITYRLARMGFFVTKLIPYGDVAESVDYVLAKSYAEKDSSIIDEYQFLSEEMVRRKLI